ncbi:MAG: hypothetical protein RI894_855, partial [Bacteroidota bacterium]|jgi:competence protein ComEC
LIIAVFLVGWLRSCLYNEEVTPDYFAHKKLADTSFIVGYLTAPPVAAKRIKVRLAVQAASGSNDDSLRQATGNIFCYLDSTSESAELKYGDAISFRARISEIEPPKNPLEIDLQHILYAQNIHHRAFIKTGEWAKVGEKQGNIIMRYAYLSQAWCVEQINTFVPNPDNAGVAAALIIGFTDDISDEIKEAYINTGAMHVLSVSGLHVGLVYSLLEIALRRVKTKKKAWKWLQMLIQLCFIWGFSLATGATAAVLRAAVMLTMVIIGKALKRDSNTMNVLSAAAFLLLIFQPYLVSNIGFQLSFLAVSGLLVFYPSIYDLVEIDFKLKAPKTIAEKRRNAFLRKAEDILDWAWQVTAVGLAAQIVTLPLSLYYFHQFPVYFWLSGWAVIPLATLALWLGMVLFIVVKIPFINTATGWLLGSIVWLMNTSLWLIEQLPFALIQNLFLTKIEAALFYIAILGASIWLFTKNPRWSFVPLIATCIFLGGKCYSYYENLYTSEWIVQNSYRKTLIGAVGATNAVYYTESLDKRSIDFTTKNFLLSKNVTDPTILTLTDTLETANYWAKPPFYQYKTIRWVRLMPDDVLHGVALQKLKLNYVVLSQNPKIDMRELMQQFDCEMIIADGSCAPWSVKRWKLQAEELKLPFWNTKEQGAFRVIVK